MTQAAVTANPIHSVSETTEWGNKVFIHPSSIIDPSVSIGDGVRIEANVVIERGVRIGEGAIFHIGCYIGEECVIGDHSVLFPLVTLREKTQIGSRVVIESGVVIGSDGFGYAKEKNGVNCKIPQVGYVIIEDEVRIGANSTIDRATLGRTIIGKGAHIGNLVQVGHNVIVGEQTRIGNGVGICGSCKIGAFASIGHGVGMVGHIRIGNHSQVDNGSGISKDVPDGARIIGSPAVDIQQYEFYQNYLNQIPNFIERVSALELPTQL